MTGGAKRGVPNPWLFEEPEETRGLGFDEIRQQQQKIIQGIESPRNVGPGTMAECDYSLKCSLYPLRVRGTPIDLLKPVAVLCLRIPEG